MSTFTNEALNVDVQLFVQEETVSGTQEALVAADFIKILGDPGIPLPIRNLAQNLERDGTLGRSPGKQLKSQESSLTFGTYMKASGTAGNIPVGADLYKGLMGVETIDPGVSVTYSFADLDTDLPSQTYQIVMGHFSIWVSGKVNQALINFIAGGTDDGIVSIDWTSMISKFYGWAGTGIGTTDGLDSNVQLATGEALRFTAGSVIVIGTDNNSGVGWIVTSSDTGTDILTVTGTPTAQASQIVKPFVPVGAEPTGEEVAAFEGYTQLDDGSGYDNFKIMTATATINNNLTFRNDEKDGDAFSGRVIRASDREVTLQTVQHFYQEYSRFFSLMDEYLSRDIKLPSGDTAGLICDMVFPDARVPTIALGGDPTIDLTLDWDAYQSGTGDNEMSFEFK